MTGPRTTPTGSLFDAVTLLREAAAGWPEPNPYTDACDLIEQALNETRERERLASPRRGGPHAANCASIITGGQIVCDCPTWGI